MADFNPNETELHILKTLYEQSLSKYLTRASIIRICKDDTNGFSKRGIIEALDVLISKRFFDKKQFSTSSRNTPYEDKRLPTIKTEKYKLSGKALLYINGRDKGKAKEAAHISQAVDSSTPYSVQRDFEKIFEQATQRILIVDNYIGRKTLDYLLIAKVPIRIITTSFTEQGFDTAKQAFLAQYQSTMDIKVKNGVFHGRFIIADDKYYVVDHSIKDYGKKPSMIVEIVDSDIQKSMLTLFNSNW